MALMQMTQPEELMKLLNMRDCITQEIYRVTGIKEMMGFSPEPGERAIWRESIWIGYGEEGDDGGGAALAAYRFGLCPFTR